MTDITDGINRVLEDSEGDLWFEVFPNQFFFAFTWEDAERIAYRTPQGYASASLAELSKLYHLKDVTEEIAMDELEQ